MENNIKKCKYCQIEIPSNAKICPNCNSKQGRKAWQIILIVGIGLLWWGIIFNILFSDTDESEQIKNTLNNNSTVHQNNGSSKGGNLATTTDTQSNKKNEYSVGSVYEDNFIAIKYVSCDNNFNNYSKYADIKNGYKVVKVEFEVENIGKSDTSITSWDFECYADGYSCNEFYNHDETYLSATLSSGKKTKGALLYEVPIDAQKIILEYDTNIFSNNKISFIIQ